MSELRVHPVTPDRWSDLVDLFERPGPRGAWAKTGACYCMFWRLNSTAYDQGFPRDGRPPRTGGPNKALMRTIVAGGRMPGLLAYRADRPVGWVAVSRRSELIRLDSSPGLRSDDEPADEGTWSISCLYVHRSEWRTGVGTAMLNAAVASAREHGATALEAYPVKPGNVDPYTGYDVQFEKAGFRRVRAGKGLGRSLWRRTLKR